MMVVVVCQKTIDGGNFWSVSAAWRFGSEKFMEPIKQVVSDGKLRASYGVNGTLPSSFYGYQNWYKYGQYYNGKSGMAIVGIGNPELQWEKTVLSTWVLT